MSIEEDINTALTNRPYRLRMFSRIPRTEYIKVRNIGILTYALNIEHSYIVMYDLDNNAVSFIQYEKLRIDEELLYYVHASGTSKEHARRGLNIILKIALCLQGYDEHALYASSIKESAFSKPMMEKFGFNFHEEGIVLNFAGVDYYINVTGVLFDPVVHNKVTELYTKYIDEV